MPVAGQVGMFHSILVAQRGGFPPVGEVGESPFESCLHTKPHPSDLKSRPRSQAALGRDVEEFKQRYPNAVEAGVPAVHRDRAFKAWRPPAKPERVAELVLGVGDEVKVSGDMIQNVALGTRGFVLEAQNSEYLIDFDGYGRVVVPLSQAAYVLAFVEQEVPDPTPSHRLHRLPEATLPAPRFTVASVRSIWGKIDRNSDGTIARSEFQRFLKEQSEVFESMFKIMEDQGYVTAADYEVQDPLRDHAGFKQSTGAMPTQAGSDASPGRRTLGGRRATLAFTTEQKVQQKKFDALLRIIDDDASGDITWNEFLEFFRGHGMIVNYDNVWMSIAASNVRQGDKLPDAAHRVAATSARVDHLRSVFVRMPLTGKQTSFYHRNCVGKPRR
mmetsp:Transcript_42272/g.92234  ORF Transcript_42272/g.92234 Transcript_42272/m.92234 type:complete len:386 (-) Transcript_42272:9-1166(-)